MPASFPQVLYLLSQLQNKPMVPEAAEEAQEEEEEEISKRERELLQRLKFQVSRLPAPSGD